MYFAFRELDSTVSPTIDELFTAIENDSFAATYDTHLAPEFQQAATREQYVQIGRSIKTRLGALRSKSLAQFNVRQMNATRVADVRYHATFEKGSGTISAELKKEGDKWLVVGFYVNSPEFQKDLATSKCPHCGEPSRADAKFCSKCGKALMAGGKAATP